MTRNYWWPGVIRDVGRYVEGCNLYQRMKNRTEEVAGKLKLSKVLEKPWTHLTVDFIMKLSVVVGKDAILVVCNRLSKMMHNVWKLHGLLESIVLDRGPQFEAELTKKLNRMLGIETRLSTAFHPQTNEQTERMNQKLEQYLKFFVDYRQKNWPE